MKKEFLEVLKLVRTDFKEIENIVTDIHISPEKLIRMLDKHKLNTYVWFMGRDYLSPERYEWFERIHKASVRQFHKVHQLILLLKHRMEEEDLHFTVIKGVGLNHCIYDSDEVRTFGDLDILVHPGDAVQFNRIFNEIGFFQKSGPTSSALSSSRYARAFTAVHAGNSGKTYGPLPYPIKIHQDKPEYLPYYQNDNPNIEMHDGLYFLSAEAVKKLLDGTISVVKKEGSYSTLDTEHSFILLITNTFENSESFFSNTYDFGAVLRDYVDLRFFFKKYKNILNWHKVERKIDEFGIRNITGIIIENLRQVYDRDVTYGCLPSINPEKSKWGVSILERMSDAGLARKSALAAMRKHWLAQGILSPIVVYEAEIWSDLKRFHKCPSCNELRYHIEYTIDSFVLSWAIPVKFQEENGSLLYQFRFFPLADTIQYTSYKVDFSLYEGIYKAYGRSTKRHILGAKRKEEGISFPVSIFAYEDSCIIQVKLPFKELDITGFPEKYSLCVCAEVYKKHYERLYHRFNSNGSESVISLIKIK